MTFRIVCCLLALAPLSIVAAPQIDTYATFHAAGVSVDIDAADDPNRNAVAVLELGTDDGTFKRGPKLTRNAATRFVGSAFRLTPGTDYAIRVRLTDPDGGPLDGARLNASVTTRAEISIPAAVNRYIVSPNGRGDDCTAAAPCALSTGVAKAAAGDHVLLQGGVYYTGNIVLPRSGAPGAPIVIRADANTNAVPILDGAEPAALRWTSAGGGVYQTAAPFDAIHLVVANGERLLAYQTFEDLKNLYWGIPGAFSDGTTLSLRLAGDVNPSGVNIAVSRYNAAFLVEQDHIYFQGITFRHYGRDAFAKAVYINGGSHNVITDCRFMINDTGVGFKRSASNNVVQNSTFSDTLFDWPWAAFKTPGRSDPLTEAGAMEFYAPTDGRGNVFRGNTVYDVFDGMNACPGATGGASNETDVYDNVIYRAGDDGISTDGVCSNVRLWGNIIHDVLVGISLAPAIEGPTYAVRNLIYNIGAGDNDFPGTGFKFNSGGGTSGVMYLYHNTVDAVRGETSALEIKTPGSWDAIVVLNNSWSGTDYALENVNTGQLLTADSNNLFSSNPNRLVRWGNERYAGLTAFQMATGLEPNGLNLAPGFIAPAGSGSSRAPDYRLTASSGLVDQGAIIAGINDSYGGAGPDIGAFERGAVFADDFSPPGDDSPSPDDPSDSGGEDDSSGGPPSAAGPSTDAEAARFLNQATFGSTTAAIAELKQLGYAAWLERQFELAGAPHLGLLLRRAARLLRQQRRRAA